MQNWPPALLLLDVRLLDLEMKCPLAETAETLVQLLFIFKSIFEDLSVMLPTSLFQGCLIMFYADL